MSIRHWAGIWRNAGGWWIGILTWSRAEQRDWRRFVGWSLKILRSRLQIVESPFVSLQFSDFLIGESFDSQICPSSKCPNVQITKFLNFLNSNGPKESDERFFFHRIFKFSNSYISKSPNFSNIRISKCSNIQISASLSFLDSNCPKESEEKYSKPSDFQTVKFLYS